MKFFFVARTHAISALIFYVKILKLMILATPTLIIAGKCDLNPNLSHSILSNLDLFHCIILNRVVYVVIKKLAANSGSCCSYFIFTSLEHNGPIFRLDDNDNCGVSIFTEFKHSFQVKYVHCIFKRVCHNIISSKKRSRKLSNCIRIYHKNNPHFSFIHWSIVVHFFHFIHFLFNKFDFCFLCGLFLFRGSCTANI
jgi:hypothetical protein